MIATEVQWSELQRDPRGVAALADSGDVRVRRRDGATLLLTREDRASSVDEGSLVAARALRSVLGHLPLPVAREALTEEFPWLSLLSPGDVVVFIDDFTKAIQISAELGQWSVLAQMIHEWKATAAINADPELARALSEPLNEDHGPVPAPSEV